MDLSQQIDAMIAALNSKGVEHILSITLGAIQYEEFERTMVGKHQDVLQQSDDIFTYKNLFVSWDPDLCLIEVVYV